MLLRGLRLPLVGLELRVPLSSAVSAAACRTPFARLPGPAALGAAVMAGCCCAACCPAADILRVLRAAAGAAAALLACPAGGGRGSKGASAAASCVLRVALRVLGPAGAALGPLLAAAPAATTRRLVACCAHGPAALRRHCCCRQAGLTDCADAQQPCSCLNVWEANLLQSCMATAAYCAELQSCIASACVHMGRTAAQLAVVLQTGYAQPMWQEGEVE